MMKVLKVIVGSLIIAITLNFFIVPYQFVSFGTDGLGLVLGNLLNFPAAFIILIINMIVILCSLIINPKNAYKYLLPSLLIPIFMFATSYIQVEIVLPEHVLAMVISAIFMGVGYTLVYQSGYKAGSIFLLEEDIGDITKIYAKIYSSIIDVLIIFIFMFQHDFQSAVYSIFIIGITRTMVNKARYNINDSKMFYVITSKEKEVKDYIIRVLGYELTELDVKGGFSQQKKSILLSVISAHDYYRLKTGIMGIDNKAFVAITDTYDVINRKAF